MSGGGETGTPDLSAILSKLTENPAILSGLVSGLSMPAQDTQGDTPHSPQPSIDPEMLKKLLPVVSALGGKPTGAPSPQNTSPSCALLTALKPFLSDDRCRAVDYMIKMDGLGGLLQNFK
ncbi:MAG: general secretion pathway protein GspK [Ruminococcaceae bacterium]|nr:general secretion pathway protein GspK [Oscillospiraceae bacterium]